jgi:hypothetical protein
LTPNVSALHPRYSTNKDPNAGIDSVSDGLSLNKWYYLAYTLSEPERRLDFYIDGQLIGFQSIQNDQTENVLFNIGPLYIGNDTIWNGFTGQIRYVWIQFIIIMKQKLINYFLLNSNFRYYNWRLSTEEVAEEYLVSDFFFLFNSPQ